jgi:hypothetical protein
MLTPQGFVGGLIAVVFCLVSYIPGLRPEAIDEPVWKCGLTAIGIIAGLAVGLSLPRKR